MLRRTFAILLSGLLLLTAFGFQGASAKSLSDQQATEKIRTRVLKMGVGVNARVAVKLRDNSQLNGYISDAGQDSFTVFERGTGSNKTVSFAETQTGKKSYSGCSSKHLIIRGALAPGAK